MRVPRKIDYREIDARNRYRRNRCETAIKLSQVLVVAQLAVHCKDIQSFHKETENEHLCNHPLNLCNADAVRQHSNCSSYP